MRRCKYCNGPLVVNHSSLPQRTCCGCALVIEALVDLPPDRVVEMINLHLSPSDRTLIAQHLVFDPPYRSYNPFYRQVQRGTLV